MVKLNFDDEDGVWRTVGGRRVFIRDGQSLSDAMKKSGKFKNTKKKGHTFKMNDEEKKKYEEVGKKIDDLTKEIDEKNKNDDIKSKKIHFAGEELYSDDPHRYDDTIKSTQARKEKFKADDTFKKENHIGWGSYNKDGIPVYENDIDYKGDFGWANLKTLSDDDLTKALNVQSEQYNKANLKSVGDGRTRNGRMDKIFKNAEVGKYEQGMQKINEEMQRRDMPRYNIYDKRNPNNILVSSPTKEMAERQIQDMYKTDISLQKEYNWKELPQYEFKVGKVDEYLNERKDNSINNALRKKAYQKYLKEHPASKITFEDFKDMNKMK